MSKGNKMESLEKATHSGKKSLPNLMLMHFIQSMRDEKGATGEEPHEVSLIRDAMGHHAAGYKKSMKDNDTDNANFHAKQYIKYGHLADKINRDDPDLLKFSATPLQPWQKNSNYYSKTKSYPNWDAHRKFGSEEGFSWLQSDPHPSSKKETAEIKSGEGYPMESVKINNKPISIDREVSSGEGHALDTHPILKGSSSNFTKSGKDINPDIVNGYHKDLHQFSNHPEISSKIESHISNNYGSSVSKPAIPTSPKEQNDNSVDHLASWLHSIG